MPRQRLTLQAIAAAFAVPVELVMGDRTIHAAADRRTLGRGKLFYAPVGTDPNSPTEWIELGWTDEGIHGLADDDEWAPVGSAGGIGRRWPYAGQF